MIRNRTLLIGMIVLACSFLSIINAAAMYSTLPCDDGDGVLIQSEVSDAICDYMLEDSTYSLDDVGDAAYVLTFWNGKPKTITDGHDREVVFYRPVERIITTNPDNSRIVISLGDLNKIIATDECTRGGCVLPRDSNDEKLVVDAWEALQTYDDGQLDELPETNTRREIDYETMAILQPDVVLDTLWYNRGDLIEEKVGCPCVDIGSGFTFEENYNQIELLGDVLDEEERANELVSFIESKVEMIESVTSQIDESEKPTVYFAPRGAKKGFYDAVEGRDFTRTEAVYEPLTIAGGINLAEECTGEEINVAPEQIVVWKPDVIFVAKSTWDGESGVDFVMETPELSEIPAVKNDQIYDCFYPYCRGRPIDRTLFNMIYMAKRLHPEEFSDIDLEAEGNEIYKELLGVDGVFTELAEYQTFAKEVY
ncbi:ABC transporter substrate-binding protein [Methanolobus bombayensis]|uniref:ABC transporter substrate-binding protein n=1 Tax=Methanolobus bombayensis TaxID=38023 RepID=UPI001AE29C87|nr:ABC transporter substrate-binding protein [Methanolobus bombayensis]MBP1908970.1 ABC-type Fe3+-hydroxamate transport system substrate-binding protein [Methanolobus bombayensis]